MRVDTLNSSSRSVEQLARLGASTQMSPETFIACFGEDETSIVEELAEVPELDERLFVGEDDDGLAGWLAAEVDDDMGRVWWWGPVVANESEWDAVADRLYAAARGALGSRITEEELAADDRHAGVARFADRHGFVGETASVLLRLAIPPDDSAPSHPRIRPFVGADAPALAALHDRLFPGTHTTGARLTRTDSPDLRLVSVADDRVTGYVTMQLEPDGSGYVDYLGVAPDHRRDGLGAALVRAGVDALRSLDVPIAFLTVREDNEAARGLYASLGFDEVRLLRPYRRGFRLG